MAEPNGNSQEALYAQLAAEITHQINEGVFQPGERLPSVRKTHDEKGLSVTTVLQAYRLLEDRGWVEARPQSGYFVSAQVVPSCPPLEPVLSSPSLDPEHVRMGELAAMVLRQAQRTDLIQFGAAVPAPDLLPSKQLNRIMIRLLRENAYPVNSCGTPEGSLELRSQVVRRLGKLGVSLSSEDLVITAGTMEAMSLALWATCQPGDLVAVESPTYFGLLQALEAQGLQALEIPTHQQDGISLEALEFALEHHPVRAVVVIPNFSNPLGSCMPDANKRALVDLLARFAVPLIEDDIYGELAFDDHRPGLAKSFDHEGMVLTCSSFSKDISPSLRVGWIAPGRFYERVVQLKMATNIGTAVLPQLVIAEFLESGGYDHHVRGIRRAYAQSVTSMAQAILRYFPAGTRVTTPQGGFVLWVQLPKQVDSLALYEKALQAGITLAPGYMFSPTPKYRNFIRLNAAYMNFSSERALQRLGNLVGEEAK